jgi:uncharacterized protein YqcC (DUF446 family)
VKITGMTHFALEKQKLDELIEELKRKDLWRSAEPTWVKEFGKGKMMDEVDFFEWLQFVYLPNRLLNKHSVITEDETYIMLQAKKYLGDGKKHERIIQLLVELDGL